MINCMMATTLTMEVDHIRTVRLEMGQSSVNLTNKGLDVTALRTMLKYRNTFQYISELRLGFNCLGDAGANLLAEYLPNTRYVSLLDLGFNGIGDDGIGAVCSKLCNHEYLTTLHLPGNNITRTGCGFVAGLLRRNHVINHLSLAGNSIGVEGAADIYLALNSFKWLVSLDLGSCRLGQGNISFMPKCFSRDSVLTYLNLNNNELDDAGAHAIAQTLSLYTRIEVLNLSFNSLTDEGCVALTKSLHGYKAMTSLNLTKNRLGDRSARALADMLPSMGLEELQIGFNEFSAMATLAIVSAISSMVSRGISRLVLIALGGNSLNTDGAKVLAGIIGHRGGSPLREMYLDHMNIGHTGVRHIATSIATCKDCCLNVLTGVQLGVLMTELGSPPALADYTNTQVLSYVRDMWASYADTERMDTVKLSPPPASRPHTLPPHKRMIRSAGLGSSLASHSTDDLTELANEIQIHTKRAHSDDKEGNGRSSNLLPPCYDPSDATSVTFNAETSLPQSSQSQILMKKLEILFEPVLQEIAKLPFDASNLWMLHQYYFSPNQPEKVKSPQPSNPDSQYTSSDAASQLSKLLDGNDDSRRPTKRQNTRNTMTRISAYPRIKYRLECMKSDPDQTCMLTLLRHLRCIEEYIEKYKKQYPYFVLIDVEDILLDPSGTQKLFL